jgi:hypothetical protein
MRKLDASDSGGVVDKKERSWTGENHCRCCNAATGVKLRNGGAGRTASGRCKRKEAVLELF